jgi:hypothetical protein
MFRRDRLYYDAAYLAIVTLTLVPNKEQGTFAFATSGRINLAPKHSAAILHFDLIASPMVT